jgi:hypothetical protein
MKNGTGSEIRLFAKFLIFEPNGLSIILFWRFQKSLKTLEKG